VFFPPSKTTPLEQDVPKKLPKEQSSNYTTNKQTIK